MITKISEAFEMQDGKHVILCVDDDADVREYLQTVLEAAGYAVVSASSAEEGKKVFKESSPDLIIVDLMMEEIDSGTAFVKELKAINNTAPIYMLTSAGDTLAMTTSYEDIGLDGIFQKPIDPDNLLNIVKTKLK